MNQILAPGTKLSIGSEGSCTIGPIIGRGGQGEVYAADIGGRTVAVKWYYPELATDGQRSILEGLVRSGAPDRRFLWPTAMAELAGDPSFGYVMALRDHRFHGIVDLMTQRVNPTFRALATAGTGLADGYYRLHSKGWCYRDISFGNAFFEPSTGDILICDNDNVGADNAESYILGTPDFMAPEVVVGKARPSTRTDLHSLAVLLFYMLHVAHPLQGRREALIHCFDGAAAARLYGEDPLFIFDPDNPDNRPDPEYHGSALLLWPLYPTFLRDLFVEAFTIGLRNPDARVREGRWRAALSRLRDSIFYCASCETENMYDVDRMRASGGDPGTCWHCQRPLVLPPRMRIGRTTVMLNHDATLFPHHLDDTADLSFTDPVAAVVQHPSKPGVWGLKNLSATHWTAETSDRAMSQIDPGRSVTMTSGIKLQFGKADGEIRA